MDQHNSASNHIRTEEANLHSRPGSSSDRDLAPEGSVPGAQAPIEADPAQQAKRHETAGGLPAIVQTVRYVMGRMGIVRGTSALLDLNQIRGFDCQSCAWPSPDDQSGFG
jgi:hypothetical protein